MDTENFALALIQVIGLAAHSMNYDGTPREYNDRCIEKIVINSIYGHIAMRLPVACSLSKIRKVFENENWHGVNCSAMCRKDLKEKVVNIVQSLIDDHADIALPR